MEKDLFLHSQIPTYLGNKRKLLLNIEEEVMRIQNELGYFQITTLDLFSGSGIVARMLKNHSLCVYANDLEPYSAVFNSCYLSNKEECSEEIYEYYLARLLSEIKRRPITDGVIRTNYSPRDDKKIVEDDRVFYTNQNAVFIDSARTYIETMIPQGYRKFFLARLLTEMSIHVNTAGSFKGFYKDKETKIGKFGGTKENALERITGGIDLSMPVLSDCSTAYKVFTEDANVLVKELRDLDIAYLDPPYNEHPYSTNNFMLNLILKNEMPEDVSKVSGIPRDCQKSIYNQKTEALDALEHVVSELDSKYIVISYNNEGFISFDEMETMLSKYGDVRTKNIKYTRYNAGKRGEHLDDKTTEFLFTVKK